MKRFVGAALAIGLGFAATPAQADSTTTIVVRDASGLDVPASILVDGHPLSAPGRPAALEPGPHQLQYTVADKAKTLSVTIVEGEMNRLIVLPADAAAPQPLVDAGERGSKTYMIGPAIAGGLGALGLFGAAGLFINAVIQDNQAEERGAASFSPSSPTLLTGNSDAAAAADSRAIGYAVGAGSLALMGGAFVWYMLAKPSPAAPRCARTFYPGFTF